VTITLIRHAKVLADEHQKMYASQVPKWVEHYNTAPVATTLPDEQVIQQIKNANVVAASALSRTYDSLALLDIKPDITDALFNEAEVPSGKIPFVKLYPSQWLVVLRVMMLVGIGKGSGSFKASKARAAEATKILIKLAYQHENVALMGHGGMNWLMGKVLEYEGWECIQNTQSSKNWGYKVYEKNQI